MAPSTEWQDATVARLADVGEPMRLANLAVFLNSLVYLDRIASIPKDLSAARNERLYAEVTKSQCLIASFSGQWKPSEYIHPFEEYYSLPGFLDRVVLPAFASAVEIQEVRLHDSSSVDGKRSFLAFVYMGFLLIHPFVEGNGRTARLLLDYYWRRIGKPFKQGWKSSEPKFSEIPSHKSAFQSFFTENDLPKHPSCDRFPISDDLKSNLRRMADVLTDWSSSEINPRQGEVRKYQSEMASIIGPGDTPGA